MTIKRGAIKLFVPLVTIAVVMALMRWPGSCRAQEDEQMSHALPSPDEIVKLPPDGGPEFNRLIFETSPYLLQHARNPVDWYPWGEEAFARARAEDKPVFLSVGYSTCHWCHVMERESFENDIIAQALNERYIAIKVDREERPDLDEIYMTATQLMTGRGGWPNSLWLDPDGRPWHAGTYFPPDDRGGQPGFLTVLAQLAEAWDKQRDAVEEQADQLQRAIAQASSSTATGGELSRELMQEAIVEFEHRFDRQRGGVSGAPKFPPHASLRLLMYEYARGRDQELAGMIDRTLEAMAHGGIHDQIGGGFHRYSTDADWLVPHFEKMLYDNAMLARAYAEAYSLTGNEYYREVTADICEWALREMRDEAGGFYSALDADSEGVEGKFYLWTREEIVAALGDEDGEWFASLENATAEGNYHDEATGRRTGENILHLSDPEGATPGERERAAALGVRLRHVRDERVWPYRDEKALAAWNGLMIGGLAHAGEALREPRYTEAAAQAAEFVLGQMRDGDRLLRSYGQGKAKLDAYLTDYAYLASGLLDLRNATGDDRWLREAEALVDELLNNFEDSRAGGFFLTSDDHEEVLVRVKKPYDQATPSGNGIAAQALVRLWQATGEERYRQAAGRTLTAFAGVMEQAPSATESLILATEMYFDAQAGTPQEAADVEAADAEARIAPVTVRAYASRDTVAPGEKLWLAARLDIDQGWHVNSHKPLHDYLRPTTIEVEGEAFEVGEPTYPDGERVQLRFSPDEMSVYRGETWLVAPVTVGRDVEAGRASLVVKLAIQACDDSSCSAPQEIELELQVTIATDASAAGPRHPAVFEALDLQ